MLRDMECFLYTMHAWRQAAPGEVTNDLIERHLMHGSNKFVYLCFMTCHVHTMHAWRQATREATFRVSLYIYLIEGHLTAWIKEVQKHVFSLHVLKLFDSMPWSKHQLAELGPSVLRLKSWVGGCLDRTESGWLDS